MEEDSSCKNGDEQRRQAEAMTKACGLGRRRRAILASRWLGCVCPLCFWKLFCVLANEGFITCR